MIRTHCGWLRTPQPLRLYVRWDSLFSVVPRCAWSMRVQVGICTLICSALLFRGTRRCLGLEKVARGIPETTGPCIAILVAISIGREGQWFTSSMWIPRNTYTPARSTNLMLRTAVRGAQLCTRLRFLLRFPEGPTLNLKLDRASTFLLSIST